MIFLSGGGSSDDSYELDELFLKSIGEKLLYIPVGLKRTWSGYDECVQWFESMLTKHRTMKEVSVWLNLEGKADKLTQENFDAVYIGGASDTFRLHKLFIENNIYIALRKFVSDGGILYGGSGGASVLGKTINYDQRSKGLPCVAEDSADLLLGYSIFPHLTDSNRDITEGAPNGMVIGITEKTGLIFDPKNSIANYVGKSEPLIFRQNGSYPLRQGANMLKSEI